MKMKLHLNLLLAVVAGVVLAGCVSTVNDRKTAAVPFVKDKVEARYERPVAHVHEAAKQVLMFNGTLLRDSSLLSQTNTTFALEGKVNNRTVWVRVEGVEPRLTMVQVQARTKAGTTDLDLVHEIDKQIALRLAR
jgi:outer membrane murein-binding lipoprotein Lpp